MAEIAAAAAEERSGNRDASRAKHLQSKRERTHFLGVSPFWDKNVCVCVFKRAPFGMAAKEQKHRESRHFLVVSKFIKDMCPRGGRKNGWCPLVFL